MGVLNTPGLGTIPAQRALKDGEPSVSTALARCVKYALHSSFRPPQPCGEGRRKLRESATQRSHRLGHAAWQKIRQGSSFLVFKSRFVETGVIGGHDIKSGQTLFRIMRQRDLRTTEDVPSVEC